MGFFDRLFMANGDVQDELARVYGNKEVNKTYKEIQNMSRFKFKETENINDTILEKYSKTTKKDVQQELMKKYLNLSRDDLNRKLLEEQQVEKEVDENLKGVDKETKDEVKKDVLEEKEELEENPKDRKEELKRRVYKAAYNRMYDDYTSKVLNAKDAQFDKMDMAVSTDSAVEMIAYEKNLEKLELMYYNSSGKNFSTDKKITKKRENFERKFDYDQNGINARNDDRVAEINRLYKIREAKYREYIDALTNPNKSPQEKALYKKDYEEANLDLVQKVPSLQEYTKELQSQAKNEKRAREAGVENKTAINNDFDSASFKNSGKSEKVTESKVAEYVDKTTLQQENRELKNLEYSNAKQEEQLEKGEYDSAKAVGDAQTSKRVYSENIEQVEPKSSISETKSEVRDEQERSNEDFLNTLRSNTSLEITPEQAEKEINDDIQKKNYQENLKNKQKQEEYAIERRKKNNN